MMLPLDIIPQNDIAGVIITTEIMTMKTIMAKNITITTMTIMTKSIATKIIGERPEVMEIDVTDTIEEAVNGPGCRARQEVQLRAKGECSQDNHSEPD